MVYNEKLGGFEIVGNETFDWDSDDYSKAMKVIIDDKNVISVMFLQYNDKGQLLYDPKDPKSERFGMGGGYVEGKTIFLSIDFFKYGIDPFTKGKYANKWTMGGVFLHEGIYHLHDLGRREKGRTSIQYWNTEFKGPNIMRARYNSLIGRYHESGNQIL